MREISGIGAAPLLLPVKIRNGLGSFTLPADSGRAAGGGTAGEAGGVEVRFGSDDLWAMNAGWDEASRTSNALSTAHDAIGVIGGILGNIQAVLKAADAPDPGSFDPAIDQKRIDSAIGTIDAIASSARFDGKRMLDGGFRITTAGGSLSLPSLMSRDLGVDATNPSDPSAQSLASLLTGNANDLSSGNVEISSRIVTTANAQVATIQSQISQAQAGTPGSDPTPLLVPGAGGSAGGDPSDFMYTAAAQMLADPTTAALAVANSSHADVLTLLQP